MSDHDDVGDEPGAVARRLRAVLELSDEGYVELRARPAGDGRVEFEVVDLNHAAALALGVPREWLLGRGVHEVFAEARAAAVVARLVEAREAGEVRLHEVDVADGPAAGLHRCRVIPTADGVTVLARRVTADERAEALREQQRHAQTMESLGRLAGGIAHDINNLLTPILAYSNMALERLDERAPLYEDLREIREAADRAAALTRQILSFSRRQPSEAAPSSLSAIVEGFARMLRRLVGDEVDLRLELATDLGAVRVDPALVEQLLADLVVQARDAIVGEGRITVRTADVVLRPDDPEARSIGAPPGAYVLLAVEDAAAATQPRPAAPGPTSAPGLVARHGGYLRCDGGPGRGARVRVYFPRAGEPVAESPAEAAAATQGEAGGVGTILLVEDDEAVRRLARHILVERGYRVLEADCGPSALELVAGRSEPLDLLLTDVVMPRMDGRALYERLLALRPGLPAVFMSGYAEVEITGERFLAKPFAASALLAIVREALAG